MGETVEMPEGGYRYLPGVFQYSAGVAASPGHAIERAVFARPVPLEKGFERIAAYLRDIGRPLAAFCACELRSPEQFSEDGFRVFNERYIDTLADWGIYANDINPVARSNVCPEVDPPEMPGFHAFAYTVEGTSAAEEGGGFVIAGSGEVPEGRGNYRDHIVRRGETDADALREKARFVLGEMERRMAAFSTDWSATSAVQAYSVHDIHPALESELSARGAARHGLTWHFARPPVVGLDYEMDCRRVTVERLLGVAPGLG